MNTAKLDRLIKKKSDIHEQIGAAATACWPIGTEVSWDARGYQQHGIVVSNQFYGGDVKLFVRNHKTLKVVPVRYLIGTGLYGC